MTRDEYEAQLRRFGELLTDDDELPAELRTGLDVEATKARAFEIIRRHRRQRAAPPSWWERFRLWWTPLRMSFAFNVLFAAVILVGARYREHFVRFSPGLSVEDQVVSVTDGRSGRLVWAHEFSGQIAAATIAPGDEGSREVLVSVRPSDGPGRLHRFDFRDDREVWSHVVEAKELVDLYGADRAASAPMWCSSIDFADLDGDGEFEVVALFRHALLFPSCARFISRGGDLLGSYFNWGYLYDTYVHDLDGDGKDEVLACGTNNAKSYQGGTIVLLDEKHLSGASVDDAVPTDSDMRDGSRARIVFPQHDPEIMALMNADRLRAFGVIVESSAGSVVIRANVGEVGAWANVALDAELNPIWVIPQDSIARRGKEWLEAGLTTIDISQQSYWDDWLSHHRRFASPGPPL